MIPLLPEHGFFIILIFLGYLGYIAWNRRREHRWIESRFGLDRVRMMSFGVGYFGRESQPGKVRRSTGFLLTTPDEVFFRSRKNSTEISISGANIQGIYHGSDHKGEELHHSVVKIDFIDDQGRKDCAAFKVPYPPQWISALQAAFLSDTP
jgi:hypothetical protein